MNRNIIRLLAVIFAVFIIMTAAYADYSFEVPSAKTILMLETDGTMTVYIEYEFKNLGQKLDYIDIGLPNNNYSISDITVNLNGAENKEIKVVKADYQQTGLRYGITLEMGSQSIPSSGSALVDVTIPNIGKNIYPATSVMVDEQEIEYVGFEFSPNYFGKKFVKGTTDYEFTVVFPEGLGAKQVYYYSPEHWPGNEEPDAWIAEDGKVVYNWVNSTADIYTEYTFGGKYPKSILTTTSNIAAVSSGGSKSSDSEWWEPILGVLVCIVPIIGFVGYIFKIIKDGIKDVQKRPSAGSYLPPQIKSDGEGIKRGLTAVEAAILLEVDLERVICMILYGLSKKEILRVTSQENYEIEVVDPLPDTLHEYEKDFIQALQQKSLTDKKTKMRDAMQRLILSVTKKMEGFSVKETREYYKSICDKAWSQVEAADTPEMKSQLLGDNFGWAMLQEEPEKKFETTFSSGDFYPPSWWWRVDPGYRRAYNYDPYPVPTAHTETVSSGGEKRSGSSTSTSNRSPMPVLPGAMFARSITNSAKGLGNSLVGNMNQFKSSVKNRTNPAPVRSYSSSSHSSGSSGGGSSCACACACASCACACAGGGR